MIIKILGTRGEIDSSAPYHSRHSGVLIDDQILLDCGEVEFLEYDPKYILITHLHPDHAFFVRSGQNQPVEIPIYAPEKYKGQKITVTKRSFHIDGYKITPIPTIHSLKVKSNAYLITHKKKKILYTGDMIWIEKKYHTLLHDCDLVITEASFMKKGGMIRRNKKTGKIFGHTGVPNLVHLFKQFTDVIVLIHFGSWFYDDIKKVRRKINELARENDVEIIVGYDGLDLVVDK